MGKISLQLIPIADGEDKSSPFCNRLRKNYRHLRKWAKRTLTDCFRIYDRDIREFPLAVDYYAGRFCVHYYARKGDDERPSPDFQKETEGALAALFGVVPKTIYWRTRAKHKATRQYEKNDDSGEFFTVLEYGVPFKVNLADYLDTGLFLDHRETRQIVAKESPGKRVLNLFAYTCAFSVHAAKAGAAYTKSVDMSNTYTAWGRDNFTLNKCPLATNPIVRADCLKFLDDEIFERVQYDLIIVDPPTISRSKKMEGLFDINTDYIPLLTKALKLLIPGGMLFFSTNARKFEFDPTAFPGCSGEEITHKTLPADFKGSSLHRCWKMMKK